MNYSIKTNIGVVRSKNQDKAAVFSNEKYQVAVLCDGMGGHVGGEHASSITIDTFETAFAKIWPSDSRIIDKWFLETIKKTQKQMKNFAKKDEALLDMGTTITIAIISKENIRIYNIGDSRAYIYNGLLHQITKDHNLRNHYISQYGYSEEKAATVLGAAALTHALGPKKRVKIDSFLIKNDKNTKFVILTSDGIHDYISKPTFEKILGNSEFDIEHKANTLIKQAIKGKSSDNLTNIIMEVK